MKLIWTFWACALLSLSAHALDASMAERTRACTHCHGEQGKAGPDGYYPRLAGKPEGYLFHQLQNFQQGRRQYDLMAVAQYLARQPLPANTSPVSVRTLRDSTQATATSDRTSTWTCGSAPGLLGAQP